MVEETQKRQVARKLWIRDLLSGRYVKEEGFKPNYVLLQDGARVSRVNFFGIVVEANSEGLPSFVLDDGTGKVWVRAFEPNAVMSGIGVGSAVVVIGRPRQFGGEMYVLPEIVRLLPDLGWLEVRRLELARQQSNVVPAMQTGQNAEEEVISELPVSEPVGSEIASLSERVMEVVRSLDFGDGAETGAVISVMNSPEAERAIRFLLQNGDMFEIRPGRLKLLE